MKFKIFNVRIELSFLCVAALTIVLLLDKSGKTSLCMLGAFVHECGHILALILCRVNIRSISLRAFDIVICAEREKSFFSQVESSLRILDYIRNEERWKHQLFTSLQRSGSRKISC